MGDLGCDAVLLWGLGVKGLPMGKRQGDHGPEHLIPWRQKAKQILKNTPWEGWARWAWKERREARLRKRRDHGHGQPSAPLQIFCFIVPAHPQVFVRLYVPMFGSGLWPPEA